jgi:hypothetical protein
MSEKYTIVFRFDHPWKDSRHYSSADSIRILSDYSISTLQIARFCAMVRIHGWFSSDEGGALRIK